MNTVQLTKLDKTVSGWMHDMQTHVMKRLTQKMTIETKSNHRDLVTNVDRETEQFYVEAIRTFDPQAKILGEEGLGDRVTDMDGHVWFVDPIDGTMNFVKQHAEFASMLAYYEDGQPVMAWIMDVANNQIVHGGPEYGVFLDEQRLEKPTTESLADGLIILSGARLLYEQYGFPEIAKAALGYRVYGSAGISYLRLLTGRAVGYISYMKPWDFAAGVLLSQALGLTNGTIDGSTLNVLQSGVVLTANEKAFDDIIQIQQK
ncbi:inositol monophosphatase family protein [Weissella soli]|uniref:inositol monophosphatase family protein n=1 Tax=Weissella soli TaxID=155866 RepID=UPI0021C1F5BD|nr:inositol monophosphatase family protein [Weissella soli]MCT8394778.1 inositol monophosphatase family protein [Weissella soli]